MAINFDIKKNIPNVTPFPFVHNNASILKYVSPTTDKNNKRNREMLTCGLSYRWHGWTDGGLWLIKHKPSSKRFKLIYTKLVITEDLFMDYARRYKYVGSIPALFYRGVYMDTEGRENDPVAMSILSDTYKSIFILQVHLKVLYTTIPGDLTFWIHPYLNSYTVSSENKVVAFGLGIPVDSINTSKSRINRLQRNGILTVRRWWEYRIQKAYMERNSPDFMFTRNLTPPIL